MQTVFLLAYEFPPLNVGGVQRPLKFVKYLPEFGIKPVVFSLDPASYPQVFQDIPLDASTEADIPAGTELVRVPSEDIVSLKQGKLRDFMTTWFSVLPREGQGWREHLEQAFAREFEKHRPTALMVTAPPFSIIPLAVDLARRYKLPLLLDMRDAWSGWNMTPYGSYFHYRATLALERRCFEAATAIIGTSDQTVADFKRLHPGIREAKFHLITNGYDQDVEDWDMPPLAKKDGKFIIGYVGSFYYSPQARQQMFTPWWRKRGQRMLQYVPQREDWRYRSPYYFFRAVRTLLDRQPGLEHRLAVRFAGQKPDWMESMVAEFRLQIVVEFLGRIPLAESLRFQASSDALLLTSSKVVDGQDYSIAGKTFEYLSMKKPIIGFVAEGAQKRLLKQTGLALLCDPDDSEGSSAQLEQLLASSWQAAPNRSLLDSLHRRKLTGQLANLITQATGDVELCKN